MRRRWRDLFEENGYTTLAPGWPDYPKTIEEANQAPGCGHSLTIDHGWRKVVETALTYIKEHA